MDILLTITNSYIPYTAAMLQSLRDTNKGMSFCIYIICLDITEDNKRNLEKSFKRDDYDVETGNINIIFPIINKDILEEIEKTTPHLGKWINVSFVLRLFAYRILPENIDKILYLDVDTVITASLKELEEKGLDNNTALAAVKDLIRHDDYERLSIDPQKHAYFNAGIMLLNLDYWRRHDIGKQCVELLMRNSAKYRFQDQDVLNIVCQGRAEYLHPRYNCMTFFFARREFLKARIREEEFDRVQEASKSPAIVHFTWPSKPWHKGGFLPKREVWLAALAKTKWRDTPIVWKDGIKGQIKHILKSIANCTLPLIGMHLGVEIYRKRRYKHIYWLSMLAYYGFAQYLPNFDSRFFGKLSNKIRVMCVRNIFDYVGEGCNIGRKARFGNGRSVYIDSRSNIGPNCDVPHNIIIGKDVMMGPDNFFLGNFTHNISDINRPMVEQGITFLDGHTEICDDVWIGRDCLFMPCLKIGTHSVVGARSVVTKDIPTSVIVAGNPAKVIKERK